MRVYNFSAGPAMMPLEVLQRAQAELLDWKGGMSVLEVSHRGADFKACAAQAEQKLRDLAGIPDNYKVLFIQGGGMGQFATVPMNLSARGDTACYINTGSWSARAIEQAEKKEITVNVIADEKDSGYTRTPDADSFTVMPDATYVHYVANETIGGVEFNYVPDAGDVPLVGDFSSNILSRPLDVASHGVIYAGTQKNMGPSGMAVVIVRNDLLDRARPDTPDIFCYRAMADADSMVNTPPTFSIYLLDLILDWIADHGGLDGMASRNQAKADLLYGFIDGSDFYRNTVDPAARSRMNVPFLMPDDSLNKTFVAQATDAGLTNLAGHRSVGGMRASIYNAMPLEGVQALVDFMSEFERTHG